MDAERIDKWLYCARFAKTRTAAQDLCNGGHVVLNGDKHFKASREIRAGDEIVVTRGAVRFHVRVTGFRTSGWARRRRKPCTKTSRSRKTSPRPPRLCSSGAKATRDVRRKKTAV